MTDPSLLVYVERIDRAFEDDGDARRERRGLSSSSSGVAAAGTYGLEYFRW